MASTRRAIILGIATLSAACSGGSGNVGPADVVEEQQIVRTDVTTPPSDTMNHADTMHDATSVTDSARDVSVAMPDVPNTGGTSCAGHNYLFCEDFESTSTGGLPTGWTIDSWGQSSNPAVTGAEQHSGTHALASAVNMMFQSRAVFQLPASLGAARGQHWGRVFYKVRSPAFMPTSGVIHNTILALSGSNDELRVVDTVENTAGAHQFLVNTPDDQCGVGSDYRFHSYDGSWHCAEWHVDQSTSTYEFYFDGAEVADISSPHATDSTCWRIPTFTAVAVGWRQYQTANTPIESWIDDIAIDSTRVGCQ